MAWLDGNSFQHDAKGWSMTGSLGTGMARVGGAGQSGYAAIRGTLGATAGATLGLSPAITELITGFCFRVSVLGSARQCISLGLSEELRVNVDPSGSLIVYRNAGAAELGRTAGGIIQPNVETYIEVRALANGTIGEVEIHINGDPTPALNLTGKNTGTGAYNAIQFLHTGGSGNITDHSAWYLLDTTGPAPLNDFLGHIRFGDLIANGNGASSDFVGSDSDSTDNYLLVDDGTSHDGDTTYVQSPTVGDFDTYALGNMPTSPLLVYGVISVMTAEKTDAGTRGFTPVIRSGGTDYDAATEHFAGLGYEAFRQFIAENPDGPATWDETSVNAMELGPKVTT